MTVRARLVVIIVAVALVPLSLSGVLALKVHQRAFDKQLLALHHSRAEVGAARVESSIDLAMQQLQVLAQRTIHFGELSPAEQQAALGLVYRSHQDATTVTLLDGDGNGVGEAVFRRDGGGPELRDHPVATMETLSAFAQHIPFAVARKHDAGAIGEPFFAVGDTTPLVSLAVPTDGPRGQTWVVAVGLSLRTQCSELRDPDYDIAMLLVDGNGRVLCGPGAGKPLVESRDDFTATAPVSFGWRVVTRQPRAQAFAASRALERQSLLLVAASFVAALLAGLLLAQRINRPLQQLTDGARALARGQLDRRVGLDSRDELGQLATAFDHMAQEIEKRESEIRAFNAELQARVDERTRELKETQAALIQSQKIAAVSSLGAGIAHEINNPLTSVLGFAQVLRARASKDKRPEDADVLAMVETEAQRIRRIVQTLLSFSQTYGGDAFTDVDANQLLELALEQVSLKGIEVVRELDASRPRILGNAAQLQEAVAQLYKNAVTAMQGKGGKLTLRSAVTNGVVKIEVADTGRGIAPENLPKIFDPFFTTKDEWRGEGLGLTIVHRIVAQHHGNVRAQSQPGAGAVFTVTLPAASRRAHLQ